MVARRDRRRSLRTVGIAAALALASAVIGIASPTAAAPSEPLGRFAVVCGFSHQSRSDPIVFPGQRGASHLHHFFGNESTGARSTPKSLRRSKSTTCNERADRSGYWVPALLVNGRVIEPKRAVVYYFSAGKEPSSIQAPPRGLRVVSGDATATAPQPRSVVTWSCFFGSLTGVFGGPTQEPVCARGATLVLGITFPDCWDGVHLDSADHKSHLAFATRGSSSGVMKCPPSHPVPIPAISLEVAYPMNGAMPGGELSSGGVYSGHGDFMDGWARPRLNALIDECIRRARDCRS